MLHSDYSLEASFCPNGDLANCHKEKVWGDWQTMGDQELIAYLKNGLRFVATFRYELRQNLTDIVDPKKPYVHGMKFDDLKDPNYTVSICNQTMSGWVSDTTKKGSLAEHPITCIWAEKDKRKIYED